MDLQYIFSTNTIPKSSLAQTMHLLGHTGEISNLMSNIN
ncbi:hypothetical protein RINTHH_15420 [Richelia intracellularis HH01]|uniref:Glutamine amidotransferase type-2 domain-containing protein n=1 Tax=Richelia intracellularis HH01 TaxID=1165094 RepID=M1WZM3_9NOST|nr:hypothetical protein RINTHH_15420 [Richelia intracellularis HH01]HAE06645.1 hypothetical protein [Richelia sp.]